VAGQPPSGPRLEPPGLEIDLIVDDEQLLRRPTAPTR
jgi:hypothetical protein